MLYFYGYSITICNFDIKLSGNPMKQPLSLIFSVFLFFLPFFAAFAQKTEKDAIISTAPYDSLKNFLGDDVARYKGQELWLKPLPKQQQEYGYANFILQYKKDDDVLNSEKNIYKCCDGYNSQYNELVNKHFFVQEVLKHPKSKKDDGGYNDEFYLQLQEIISGDIVYYKYTTDSEFTFPFIVMGFLEKQKSLVLGEEYVFADNVITDATDIISGQKAITTVGAIWKCVDLRVDSDEQELSVIVQNGSRQKIAVPLSVIKDTQLPLKVYDASQVAIFRKRFGNYTTFNRILQQKIVRGMTKEMCRMSWGEPLEKIETENGSAKLETWTYPANSISFRNGRVVSIN